MKKSLICAALTCTLLACGCSSTSDDSQAAKHQAPANNPSSGFPDKDPPIQVETHFAAAQLAETQRDMQTAINQYRKTLEMKPDHIGATFRLANLYTQLGQFEDAIPVWQRYVELTRSSAEAFSDLAYCYDLAGKNPEAERNYQLALKRDPNCEAARINFGIMLASLGRMEEAVHELGTALSAPAVHYYVGLGRERHGDQAGALAEYRTALTMDPELKEAQARVSAITSAAAH